MADEIPGKLSLTVVTRERKVVEAEVDEVRLPARRGYVGILPGHTPLLTMLHVGELMWRTGNEEHQMVVRWGFAEILPDRVIILAEGATLVEEIDVHKAEQVMEAARKELESLASHDEEFAVAQAKLEESVSMISISRGH